MTTQSLSKLIKTEYLKSIIFPLIVIEMMLLWAYFWSNSYVNETTKNALVEETKVHIKEISTRSAEIINHEFKSVSNMTALFQQEHQMFFAHYDPSSVSTKETVYVTSSNDVIYNVKNEETSCSLFFSNAQKTSPKPPQ